MNQPIEESPEDLYDGEAPSEDLSSGPQLLTYDPTKYVLVDKALYAILCGLLEKGIQPAQTTKVVEEKPRHFEFRVLRQYWLGDTATQLHAGDMGTYIPNQSLRIGGNEIKKLRSFNVMWDSHPFGRKPTADFARNPVFEITNPNDCPDLPPQAQYQGVSESERIYSENMRGDAARRPAPLPGDPTNSLGIMSQGAPPRVITSGRVSARDLPPPGGRKGPDGLTERGRILKNMRGDAIDKPAGSLPSNTTIVGDPIHETVDSFPIQNVSHSSGIIGGIPGPRADEGRRS